MTAHLTGVSADTSNNAAMPVSSTYTTDSVSSKDGTVIGYRQFGSSGPGLVLIQGTMGTAQHFIELATLLASHFSVYTPDRRGRGISGAGVSEYSLEREVEDLDALLNATGASHVFGLSAGGIIALQAALTLPQICKLVIYEPPLFIDAVPVAQVMRYEREMAEGKVAAALVTAMQASQMGPPVLNLIPRGLLEWLIGMAIKRQDQKGAGEYPTMRELAPTLHNDFHLVTEMDGKLDSFRAIQTEVMLLGGSQSPAYLKAALNALERIIPHTRRVELQGAGHAAPWNTDQRGNPKPVAEALLAYFKS